MKFTDLADLMAKPYEKGVANPSTQQWGDFMLKLGVELTIKIRNQRHKISELSKNIKSDGSPATDFEFNLETYALSKLREFHQEVELIGEEHGGESQSKSFGLVMDPVDGTRSFLSYFDSYAISICITNNRNETISSFVSSPASGDIFLRTSEEATQLFSFDGFDGHVTNYSLPLYSSESAILLNIHPAVKAKDIIDKAYQLWASRDIRLVRSVSGSPSLSMVKASIGTEYYINAWSTSQPEPYDLLAAYDLLKGAGGYAVDNKGKEINPRSHTGIFIAGMEESKIKKILELLFS